jgi:hypothetical protein
VSLHLVPVSFADACAFVSAWHRHHEPPVGHKFSVGVADDDGVLRGVAMVGRPVASNFDDGLTLEVNRTATDGTRNVNSMLYRTAWTVAKGLGYQRLVTYTQPTSKELLALRLLARLWGWDFRYDGESGASLRAAGWQIVAERRKRKGWTTPSRPREGRGVDGIQRLLWEAS